MVYSSYVNNQLHDILGVNQLKNKDECAIDYYFILYDIESVIRATHYLYIRSK